MKRVIIIIVSVLVIFVISFSIYWGILIFDSSFNLLSKVDTSIDSQKEFLEESAFDLDGFVTKYHVRDSVIESSFQSHDIPITYFIAKDSSFDNSTVIIVHSLGGNRYSQMEAVSLFLKIGYNVLTFDQRSSGDNNAQYNTFGVWESFDLIDCVHYVDSKISAEKNIIIWGVSYGATTVGVALADEFVSSRAECAILDSPMLGMRQMISDEIRMMDINLPTSYLLFVGNIVTKFKLGFSYSDSDVVDCLAKTQLPYLVFNSKTDSVTPYEYGEKIFSAATNRLSAMSTFEDAPHGLLCLYQKEIYSSTVKKFLLSCEGNKKREE